MAGNLVRGRRLPRARADGGEYPFWRMSCMRETVMNDFGRRFAKNFDTLAYAGKAPIALYLGHQEWLEFEEYLEPMRRYSVPDPSGEKKTKYRDVEIIHVLLP